MRKLFLALSLLIILALMLGACGAAPAAPADTAAAGTDANAAEATVDPNLPTPEPTPVVNAFGTCDDPMRLWHGLTGSDGNVFSQMLQQFAEANPDVCFESQGIPWDLFFQKYPTAVAAGTPPDMVIFHAAEVQQMANEGLMQPMDDFFTGKLTKDQFNESLINQITVDGKTMAAPFDNHGWMLWANTQAISAAGLDPTVVPANGTEFIDWGQKVTVDVNGKHPNEEGFDADHVKTYAIVLTWPRYFFPSILWQYGASVVSADGKTATLDSPEAIAAIQYVQDLMYKYHIMDPYQTGVPWASSRALENGIGYWWEGTWTNGFMLNNPDLGAHVEPMPLNSLAPDGKKAVKFDSHVFSIPTGVDEKGKADAYKLATYLIENGAYWANSGQVPALKSVQASPEVQAVKSVAVAAKQFNDFGSTDFASKNFIEIQTAYEVAMANALSTPDADVAAALKEGNATIQAILDRP